ncbi:MAG: alpha/beta hydrolase [Rhodospirillales bacterium]|nr:alpha/beta hydrolase [Rhodospirillales bacterium]
MIRRRFVDLPDGQIHLREAGAATDAVPLALIHPSPGSSKQLEGLMHALSATRRVVAPDTRGNGDSTPSPRAMPDIPHLAAEAFKALDQVLPDRFDLYGSHTGASIAMEIAIAHPDRVRRLVIDGMGLYASDEQSEVLQRYAREIVPDLEATHLMQVWHFCRDQYLFWPYYNRSAEGRLPNGLPDAGTFHDFVVEVLKAMRSYHHSYRAAFRHPKRDRLPLLRLPVLVACSPSDMLHRYFHSVTALVPGATIADLPAWSDPDFEAGSAAVIAQFLDQEIVP